VTILAVVGSLDDETAGRTLIIPKYVFAEYASLIVSTRGVVPQTVAVRAGTMTAVDNLWYLADEASQQAEQTYHRLATQYDEFIEFETEKHVSRRRFRTVAERIQENGAPYGAHTLAHDTEGQLLLVRHDAVDLWVLPGGETTDGESFREAAERELHEEAGLGASYDGLGMLGRVTFYAGDHSTWGVLPLFEASAETTTEPTVQDPDDEISAAEWFDDLPPDTRDRAELRQWRRQRLEK
jgi:8-oxo-dGTP pyrophosphatase MutT (NUDIX family)